MTLMRPPRTLGPGHDDFWAGCAGDELRLPRCTACHTLQWPIAAQCDRCGSSDFQWERLSGRAMLVSWCRFHQDYYKGLIAVPYDTILVRLEEGPLFISNPQRLDPAAMRPDLPLKVTFVDAEDHAGRFRLPVFTQD